MAEWSEWQLEYLLDNYDKKTNLEIARHVDKSEAGVAQKLHYLKIKRTIDHLSLVRDTKRNAFRMLFEEWDKLFGFPPKE